MQYWWVNQNLTYKHEVHGSYLWSPKRTADNRRNTFYDNMQLVRPGDVVFSFADTYIKAIGVVDGLHLSAPKPAEFGNAGNAWDAEGWFVPTIFHKLRHPIRPKDFMPVLLPHLPPKYSPLQQNGNGNQGVYLAAVPEPFAYALIALLGPEAEQILDQAGKGGQFSDNTAIAQVLDDGELTATQRSQVIQARIGQGLFRSRVAEIELSCRITGIADERFLIASHIKPWSKSSNLERLDGHNGLLLTPHIDRLFDKGYLTFGNDGRARLSRQLPEQVRLAWLPKVEDQPKPLTQGQRLYMEYHRDEIFQRAIDA
jgi:hypothetical protein